MTILIGRRVRLTETFRGELARAGYASAADKQTFLVRRHVTPAVVLIRGDADGRDRHMNIAHLEHIDA